MISDSIEKIMEISMMDALVDLKSGKELNMQFYLFFKDGYCKVPPFNLPKEVVFGIIHLLLNHFKPEAFCVISDCFVRDAQGNLMYEQLMAFAVEKNGQKHSLVRPYDRAENGDVIIRPPEPSTGTVYAGGIVTTLYTESPIRIVESSQALLLQSFSEVIKNEKVPYQSSPFSSRKHKLDDGITLH